MKRTGWIYAALIVLISNGIALLGTARNRAGGPVETVELTELELPLVLQSSDNTGVRLRLNWRRPAARPLSEEADIFDCEKMKQLGFRWRLPPGASGRSLSLVPREAFVVLERGEEPYGRYPASIDARASEAEASGRPAQEAPRLFVADASLDRLALMHRYPDPSRHLIVRGIVRCRLVDVKDPATGKVTSHECRGRVLDIIPSEVYVPLPQAETLTRLISESPQGRPRYTVMLQYGRRLEPRVVEVKPYGQP